MNDEQSFEAHVITNSALTDFTVGAGVAGRTAAAVARAGAAVSADYAATADGARAETSVAVNPVALRIARALESSLNTKSDKMANGVATIYC